ncbi:MAG: HD domain-containing protein [Patescibacteria group bacterium]|nr:HD domain-containing protein [Patescibacteria group bacterium]
MKKNFEIVNSDINSDLSQVIDGVVKLPEMQRLSSLIENNEYHDSENVLSHMEDVFFNMQELLNFNFITSLELKDKYKKYFNKLVDENGKYIKGDLLLLASAIHDIGKGVEKEKGITYLHVINEENNTESTGHEQAGAKLVPKLLESSDLIASEIEFVQNIVKLHDTFSKDFCLYNLKKDVGEDIKIIQKINPLCIELLLHIIADNHKADVYKEWSGYFLNELFNSEFLITN